MLLHLAIRDFVIVDTLDLEFRSGFTSLTGETGAGKSILIDALSLALGDRADAAQVRAGAERADISAEFSLEALPEVRRWLADQALEGDADGLILRRLVDRNGRSRAFINGHAATLAQLREAGERLVDIHGQHAHHSLLRAETHRQILDAHAGLGALARATADAYRAWQQLAKARVNYEAEANARNQEREQLTWQVEELDKLAPAENEWESLGAEHSRLSHAASLIEGARATLDALSEADAAALAGLSAALSSLRPLVAYDATLGNTMALLESADAQIQEAAQDLRRYADRVELDPSRLRQVEVRIDALHSTARRLRIAPEQLPAHRTGLKARLTELEIASDLEALVKREQEALAEYRAQASRLTAERAKAATKLAREVTAAMKDLAMKGGRFEVALVRYPPEGSTHGNESVEFLVATATGAEPRPLAKVASGGELSRISLAIQVITSKAAAVPTLIFDEVDSGIGGAVAEVVGRRLKALGAGRQVLCVTHLPQVAAQADQQWRVSKPEEKRDARSKSASRVQVLDAAARVEEIARMLGGVEITATTRRHAAEMLGIKQPA
jgi:DNA repair protein RecN (Recombination protein N)